MIVITIIVKDKFIGDRFKMKKILIIIALAGVFAAPVFGNSLESLENLKTVVNKSMTTINDYRNNFQDDLFRELDSLEQEVMNGIYETSYKVSNLVREKLAEAEEKSIDAGSCAETLDTDLNEIVSSVHPKLTACENIVMMFTRKFTPFIGQQGNTGYVMLEGLNITTKNLAEVPNDAEKCYKNFEWYASAISFNYGGAAQALKGALDHLQDFLKGDFERCFQRPVVHGKRDLEALGQKVVSCIDQQINQH